jgi:hypothetical protein
MGDVVHRNWDGHGKLRERRFLGLVAVDAAADKQIREHICRLILPLHLPRLFKPGEVVSLEPTKQYRLPNGILRLSAEHLEAGGERFVLTSSGVVGMPEPRERPGASSTHDAVGGGDVAQQETTTQRTPAKLTEGGEEIRRRASAFIEKIGECNVGVGGITKPGSAALTKEEFQADFELFAVRFLRREFKRFFWVGERQPGTRDWHVHWLGDMGYDLRTGFSFEQYVRGDYRSVPVRLRNAWRRIADGASVMGYGRSDLLPIRTTAHDLVSYLAGGSYGRNPGLKPSPELHGMWEFALTSVFQARE